MVIPLSADRSWQELLRLVLVAGSEVCPRGRRTKELLHHTLVVDMTRPIITLRSRHLGYRFMCAEAAWVISGDDRVETISPYSKIVSNFSDDGVRFFGAYGPKFRSQLDYVADILRKDLSTRQAVFNIWRENPPPVRDCPCTLSSQFLVRDEKLHTFVTMRSNDVWLGAPYDIFTASMWSAYLLLKLNMPNLQLGNLYHTAHSRHLYEENWSSARECAGEIGPGFSYESLNVNLFSQPDDLLNHLWRVAELHDLVDRSWLCELPVKKTADIGAIRQ